MHVDWTSIRNFKFCIKMRWNTMFITAFCVIFLIKINPHKEPSQNRTWTTLVSVPALQ